MHVESNILKVKHRLNNLSSNYVSKIQNEKDNIQMREFFEEQKLINKQQYTLKKQKRSSFLDSLN
jgi:hypothetical protein